MSRKLEPRYVVPTLESITTRGTYKVPFTDFDQVAAYLEKELPRWLWIDKIGQSIRLLNVGPRSQKPSAEKIWSKRIETLRSGVPVELFVTAIEHSGEGIIAEVQCMPAMWHKIAKLRETTFTENEVQEALLESRTFVKQVMSGLKGKEIEPVSVYPIMQRTEIKSRLQNLGLKEIVDTLDKAEEHIVQNDFPESLKSSRTAFEKMIDWQMNKRGLAQTNSYHNNLERIKSKGYLDPETAKLLQTYYECLSIIVHEKGVKPRIFEAQMGYGITLIMLDYFANKLP